MDGTKNDYRAALLVVAGVASVAWAAACGDGGREPTSPDPPRPTTVTVAPAMARLDALGSTVQLAARVGGQHRGVLAGNAVAWTSDDTPVATADGSSMVTGRRETGRRGSRR